MATGVSRIYEAIGALDHAAFLPSLHGRYPMTNNTAIAHTATCKGPKGPCRPMGRLEPGRVIALPLELPP
jgi:hypothetical protein